MWIETPEHLQQLKPPEFDEPVDLSDGGSQQVTKDVGELLIDKYDAITQVE